MIPKDSHLTGKSDTKWLGRSIRERLLQIDNYPELVKFLKKEAQDPLKGFVPNFEHAMELFKRPDYENSLKEFAYLLIENPDSPVAHHYIGNILSYDGLYLPAHLLYDKGLRLDVPDVNDEFQTPNLHRRFHFDLVDMAHWISVDRPELTLQECGYPISRFHSAYKKEKQREGKLVSIHNQLARVEYMCGKPHKADNCPYFRLID